MKDYVDKVSGWALWFDNRHPKIVINHIISSVARLPIYVVLLRTCAHVCLLITIAARS